MGGAKRWGGGGGGGLHVSKERWDKKERGADTSFRTMRWVKRAHSYLDQVCEKKRNRLDVSNLKELLFLALLKLNPKDSWSYKKEIEILCADA